MSSDDGGDQKVWRALEKPYREWLVKRGIAVNADAFNALPIQDRLSASTGYTQEGEIGHSSTIHGDMSEEVFQDASALEAWLKGKDVDPVKAAPAAAILFVKEFDSPSTLIGIGSNELQACGLAIPVAQHIHNKLKDPHQQPNGELSCCFCIFVFKCCFVYVTRLNVKLNRLLS
jgi:hypothetical protein